MGKTFGNGGLMLWNPDVWSILSVIGTFLSPQKWCWTNITWWLAKLRYCKFGRQTMTCGSWTIGTNSPRDTSAWVTFHNKIVYFTTINNWNSLCFSSDLNPYFTNSASTVTVTDNPTLYSVGTAVFPLTFTDANPDDVSSLTVSMMTASTYFELNPTTCKYFTTDVEKYQCDNFLNPTILTDTLYATNIVFTLFQINFKCSPLIQDLMTQILI